MLLGTSRCVFDYSLSLLLWWCETYTARVLQTANTEFLVFALFSFPSYAHRFVYMSKTADPHFVSYGLEVFVPMPACLSRGIDDLGFFSVDGKTLFDLMLTNFGLHRSQEIDRSRIDLKTPFVLCR